MTSVVPLPGTKPNHLSNLNLKHMLNKFHYLICKFEASVISPFQGIAFALIKIEYKALLPTSQPQYQMVQLPCETSLS